MKTTMNNFKIMLVMVIAIFTLFFSNTVLASGEVGSVKAELHFVTNAENQPMFRLVLNNNSNTCYVVTVTDKNGDVLFAEKISGTNISRLYKLNVEHMELIAGTTFSITNKSTRETALYKINSLTNVAEEVTVAKL